MGYYSTGTTYMKTSSGSGPYKTATQITSNGKSSTICSVKAPCYMTGSSFQNKITCSNQNAICYCYDPDESMNISTWVSGGCKYKWTTKTVTVSSAYKTYF